MITRLVQNVLGRKPEFRRVELMALFAAMKDAGIETKPVDKFAKRLSRGPRTPPGKSGSGMLRFDIHGNMERTLRVAQDLAALEMRGVFMMMHRHPVNSEIYTSPATWDALKRIADLGHEIGLHFDPFYLIRAHHDLYVGLRAAMAELAERSFQVEVASLHGDTRDHIKAVGLQSNDFFSEGFRASRWNGKPPAGEEFLADHVKRYSQVKIAEGLGIRYFVEPHFTHMGQLISEQPPAYLSDNRRQIRINNLFDEQGNGGLFAAPEPWRISSGFAREAAEILKTRPFLALLHPQWYA